MSHNQSQFTEDYFLKGESLGISGYTDYRWLHDETLPMAAYMKRFLGIKDGSTVLDVGASRGYLVKALRMLSVEAYGYDISEWAVANCDPAVIPYMSTTLDAPPMSYDFVVSKDCMEHVPEADLRPLLVQLLAATRKALIIIVPLTAQDGGAYLCPRDEGDKTHVIRWNMTTWLKFLGSLDRRCVVSGSTWVPGIKEANCKWEGSCGFYRIERV